MKVRSIDKSKKSNIKCEHCDYWHAFSWEIGVCVLTKKEKYYYQRCKNFDWRKGLLYKDD